MLTVQHQRLRRIEARLLLLCSRGLTITMSQLPAGSNWESARDGFLRRHGRFSEFYASKSCSLAFKNFLLRRKNLSLRRDFD